jgi:hypothetical protein
MKETPRRRITVTSSLNEISTDQLGNRVGARRGRRYSARPNHRDTYLEQQQTEKIKTEKKCTLAV